MLWQRGRKHVGVGDTAQVETVRQGPEETLRRGQLIHVTETQKARGDGAEGVR